MSDQPQQVVLQPVAAVHELRRRPDAEGASPTTGGTKHDDGKNRWDILPDVALEHLATVMTFGAKKYGPYNYRKGMAYGRLFAAAMRHLWEWKRGNSTDYETGLPHLAHAAACCLMLLDLEKLGIGDDDRWQPQPAQPEFEPFEGPRS